MDNLALTELEAAPGALAAVLLSLFYARVAGEETEFAKSGAQLGVRFQ